MSLRVRLSFDPTASLSMSQSLHAVESLREPTLDLNETLPFLPVRREQPAMPQVRCIRCEGKMERGTAPVHIERDGYRVAWDGLPAWVCCRCEASYFEEPEVKMVRRALGVMKQLSARDHA
jgi:YgiT-type zinc finger domain-containing protein